LCTEAVHSHKRTYRYLDEQFLQFSGLGFVTLSPFHCVWIYLHLSVCILCVSVLYCIDVVLLWAWWGRPDGIEAWSL